MNYLNIIITALISSTIGALVGGVINYSLFSRMRTMQDEIKDLRDDKLAGLQKEHDGMSSRISHMMSREECWRAKERDANSLEKIEKELSELRLLIAQNDRTTAEIKGSLGLIMKSIGIKVLE